MKEKQEGRIFYDEVIGKNIVVTRYYDDSHWYYRYIGGQYEYGSFHKLSDLVEKGLERVLVVKPSEIIGTFTDQHGFTHDVKRVTVSSEIEGRNFILNNIAVTLTNGLKIYVNFSVYHKPAKPLLQYFASISPAKTTEKPIFNGDYTDVTGLNHRIADVISYPAGEHEVIKVTMIDNKQIRIEYKKEGL